VRCPSLYLARASTTRRYTRSVRRSSFSSPLPTPLSAPD
jgi:hypothetical protein